MSKYGNVGRHTEAISVLHPIVAVWSLRAGSVDVDVVEYDISSIHHIDRPQLRLYDVEVLDRHIRDIPEYEGHWASGLSCAWRAVAPLSIIPDLAIAIDPTSTVTINADVVASYDKASCVVLKLNVVAIVAPVVQILREQPLTLPVDGHIVDNRVELRVDVVCLVGREDNVAAVAASLEGLDDGWRVIGAIVLASVHCASWPAIGTRM